MTATLTTPYHQRRDHDRYPEQTALQKMMLEAVRSTKIPHTELSRRTGIGRPYVSEVLNGRVRGTLTTWQKLLDAADIEIGWRVTPTLVKENHGN